MIQLNGTYTSSCIHNSAIRQSLHEGKGGDESRGSQALSSYLEMHTEQHT